MPLDIKRSPMQCAEIPFGSALCAYSILLPYRLSDGSTKTVCVDKCLLPELLSLWEQGIHTTGCCCGHGRAPAFIGVAKGCEQKMLELGYCFIYGHFDTFVPKTVLTYGESKQSFFKED